MAHIDAALHDSFVKPAELVPQLVHPKSTLL